MNILLAYRTFSSFAGSEIYLLTVAEQLQILGHDVAVHAVDRGAVADLAEERGVRVFGQGELPPACDALLVQDGEMAPAMAERYPRSARVFVAHSTEFLSQRLPQSPGVVHAAVAMNDRVRVALEATPGAEEVVRLHQPVDVLRFARLGVVPDRPRRVLVFGHDHAGGQLERISRVCAGLGLEARLVGRHGRTSSTPELEIADSDIVVGIGRCVIEAMASRTAAYVSGVVGTDGWVTPESYPRLEADGFSGRATGLILDEHRLRSDLAAWTPELAEQGKDLAFAHHDVARHAEQLVGLWRRLGAREEAPSAVADLARMARVARSAEARALTFGAQATDQRLKAEGLRRQLDALRTTRRYRLAGALAGPLDLLRRWRGAGPRGDRADREPPAG